MKYLKQCNGKFKQIKNRQDVVKELVKEFYVKDNKSFCNSNTLAKDLVFRIHDHFNLMPNDWIYDKIHGILLDASSDGQLYDDVDSYIDIYTSDLIDWSKQFQDRVDDVLTNNETDTLSRAVGMAQYYVLSEIVSIINDFINDQVGEC